MSRTLIVGDIHGCAGELAALVDDTEPTHVIAVGDLFTKGPDPRGVWRILQSFGARSVLGNHDAWVLRHPERWSGRLPRAALDWLNTLPLILRGDGWRVVHAGLSPDGSLGSPEQATTLRRWPDDSDPAHPFWWQLYQGPGLVIHGHDAVRGLVDRRPLTLGLDTGCVYGGRLTGYLVEDDRLHSVRAARVYRRPGAP